MYNTLRIISVILAILFVAVLSGCKPTPEEPIVRSKNDGKQESIIGSTAMPAKKYEAASEWKATYEHDDITVSIDASVNVPDVTEYPVYRMYRESITKDLTEKIQRFFIGNEDLYEARTIYREHPDKQTRTKADVLKDIEHAEKMIDDLTDENSDNYKDAFEKGGNSYVDSSLSDYQNALKVYLAEYKNAPEGEDPIKVNEVWQLRERIRDGLDKESYYGSDTATIDGRWEFYVKSREDPYWQNILVRDHSIPGIPLISTRGRSLSDVEGAKYSADDAQKMADGCLHDLDMSSDWSLSYACTVYSGFSLDTYKDYSSASGTGTPRSYYVFEYTPSVGKNCILSLCYYQRISTAREGLMSPDWSTPYIDIVIDSELGFYSFNQFGAIKCGELLNANVELIPFSEVQEIAEQYIALSPMLPEYSNDEHNPSPVHRYVSVTKIELGYLKRSEKDNLSAALTIPTWLFYGTLEDEYADGRKKTNEIDKMRMECTPVFCINAIDGSIIDLRYGD